VRILERSPLPHIAHTLLGRSGSGDSLRAGGWCDLWRSGSRHRRFRGLSPRRASIGSEHACTRGRSSCREPFRTKKTGRVAGSCMKARGMTDKEEWVVWNGSMGILDMATIGYIEDGDGGRSTFLAPPYGVVGPFSLDELETRGRIALANVSSCRARDGRRIRSICASRREKNAEPSCFSRISTATIRNTARS